MFRHRKLYDHAVIVVAHSMQTIKNYFADIVSICGFCRSDSIFELVLTRLLAVALGHLEVRVNRDSDGLLPVVLPARCEILVSDASLIIRRFLRRVCVNAPAVSNYPRASLANRFARNCEGHSYFLSIAV